MGLQSTSVCALLGESNVHGRFGSHGSAQVTGTGAFPYAHIRQAASWWVLGGRASAVDSSVTFGSGFGTYLRSEVRRASVCMLQHAAPV